MKYHLIEYKEGETVKYYNPLGDDSSIPSRKYLMEKYNAIKLVEFHGWRYQNMKVLSADESEILLTISS